VLHFPTRGRNVLRLQGDLLATHALGVRNIFIVMGDPTEIGDFPEAMDDYDLVPSGLVRLVKQNFNIGTDLAGTEIGDATAFFVGCALNLDPHDPEQEMRVFHKKITSGADFALTQPIYDPDKANRFLNTFQKRYGGGTIPILVGVLPLYTYRHALFLHHEVPGIVIPDATLSRMENAGENAASEGVHIATELIDELRPKFQGIYIMPPFNRYEIAAEIIEHTRSGSTPE
jgi:homocysteine S-methyltransferase